MPPDQIIKDLGGRLKIRKNRVQRAIRDLVAAGELAYTFEHGRTFLEPSFDRPVRVGERIVLTPPGKEFQPGPGDVVICIAPGASFGGGRHPTTRLALRGVEFALTHFEKPPYRSRQPDARHRNGQRRSGDCGAYARDRKRHRDRRRPLCGG